MLTKIKKTNQIISLPVEPTQSNQLPTGNEIEDKLISKSKELKYSLDKVWYISTHMKTVVILIPDWSQPVKE